VIQLTSALATRDHGDARRALDILRSAGKLAEKDESDSVTEDHVRQADEYSDLNRSIQVIKNGTPHSRYALYALAYLTKSKLSDSFSTGELYDTYCIVAEIASGESHHPSARIRSDEKWTLPEITESRHTGGGKGEGSYRTHRSIARSRRRPSRVYRIIGSGESPYCDGLLCISIFLSRPIGSSPLDSWRPSHARCSVTPQRHDLLRQVKV